MIGLSDNSFPIVYPRKNFSQRKVFPFMGRALHKDDVGKNVVRVFPFKAYDWTWVPKSHHPRKEDVLDVCCELEEIGENGIKLKNHHVIEFLDHNWCQAEELIIYIENNPGAGIPFAKFQKPEPTLQLAIPRIKIKIFKCPLPLNQRNSPKQFEHNRPIVSRKLPEHPGCIDYSYSLCQPVVRSSLLPTQHPDFTSNDPFKILGIDPTFTDQSVIGKRYRELSRRYHPDKEKGSSEAFRSITMAYEQLLTKHFKAIDEFTFPIETDFEVMYESAMLYNAKLEKMGEAFNSNEIEKLMLLIEKFLVQIQKIDLTCCKEKEKEVIFRRLIRVTSSKLDYYKIKLILLNIRLPDSAHPLKNRIEIIFSTLEKLKAINLDEINWNFEKRNLLCNAFLSVLDKYIAFQRSLAELYLKDSNYKQFNQIFKEVGSYIAKAYAMQNMRMTEVFKDEIDFLKLVPLKRKQIEDQVSQSKASSEEEQKEEAGTAEIAPDAIVACQNAQKVYNLEVENSLLEKNIKTNRQFFDC